MTKTLAVNAGSSSMKWQMYEMPEEKVLAKGLIERIGLKDSIVTVKFGEQKEERVFDIPNHTEAVEVLLEDLKRLKIVEEFTEITGVGHRVVAGGEIFQKSTVVTPEVLQQVKDLSALAPLHNPANAAGIEAFLNLLPDATSVVVFDTAFHQTMPKSSYLYGLPYEYYEKYKVRRYGFHGTSHKYVAQKTAEILNKKLEDINIITCHLGNGASVTAVEKGHSVDTSMGFTPLEGLIMGTRCGDIDPAMVTFLMEKENLSTAQINDVMNKKSGVLGISKVSSDFRDVETEAEKGNENAKIALETYYKKVKKYIGAYMAEMGSVDAIVFTAGLGENSSSARLAICGGMEGIGIEIDAKENDMRGEEKVVSKPSSKISVLVVPTNEELMIARDTLEIVKSI